MGNATFQEFERRDEKGRTVRTQFITRNGEFDWIRVTTIISKDVKLRSDYYKDENPELFESIKNRDNGKSVK